MLIDSQAALYIYPHAVVDDVIAGYIRMLMSAYFGRETTRKAEHETRQARSTFQVGCNSLAIFLI